jgi:hypothetical protein
MGDDFWRLSGHNYLVTHMTYHNPKKEDLSQEEP